MSNIVEKLGEVRESLLRQRFISGLLTLLLLAAMFFSASILVGANVDGRKLGEHATALLRQIGFFFLSISVLGLMYQRFASKLLAEQISEQVSKALADRVEIVKEVSRIYPNRHAVPFAKYIDDSRYRIDVLTTNLNYLMHYHERFTAAAKRREKVRILCSAPESSFVRDRFPDLKMEEEADFSDEIRTAYGVFEQEAKKFANGPSADPDMFQVRQHNRHPTKLLFRFDNRLILGFILHQGRARRFMHVEFECSIESPKEMERMSNALLLHFDSLWNSADVDCTTDQNDTPPDSGS